MSRILTTKNPVFVGFDKIIDVAWLSILWLLFCIPIVTIGASSSALYYTVVKVIKNERSYIFREFWSGFKSCFKQSTAVWLIYLAAVALMIADSNVLGTMDGQAFRIIQNSFWVLIVLLTAFLLYALAYVARFKAPLKTILRNSVLFAIVHFPQTILVMLVFALGVLLIYFTGIALILVPGYGAYLISSLLEKVFVRHMTKEDLAMEDLRNHPEKYEYFNRDETTGKYKEPKDPIA